MRTSLFLLLAILLLSSGKSKKDAPDDDIFLTYTADTKKADLQFYWKDDKNEPFRSIENLKTSLAKNKKKLVFAMNGGMYKTDNSPLGLYIEKQKVLSRLNKASASGNFYLKPNGVFYITTDNTPIICNTTAFVNNGKIKYATQSGPMLVIDGKIHSAFTKGSSNLNVRNGVGILPDNKVIFVMSKKWVNFYDFAEYFQKMGCKNALYLDGFVSQTYLPEKNWIQTGGNFGVMIGVAESVN